MFIVNEDNSMYITRGDVAFFSVSTETDEGEVFKFQPGDVVRFKVTEKKACDKVVLSKDVGIEAETEEVLIYLEEKDTKIGSVISKPKEYWYEVELNPYTDPQTILGYDDEDGAKIFKLFPEGGDAVDEDPITPEDIPVVDEELSLTSTRPVQNQAIARAIIKARDDVAAEFTAVRGELDGDIKAIEDRVTETLDEYNGVLEEYNGVLEDSTSRLDAKIASLNGEDITDSFVTELQANTLIMDGSSVFKQGNIVHGSLIVRTSFVLSEPTYAWIFKVNEAYRPRGFAYCVAKYVDTDYKNEDATVNLDPETYTTIPLGLYCINNTGVCTRVYPYSLPDTGHETNWVCIDFTYICV